MNNVIRFYPENETYEGSMLACLLIDEQLLIKDDDNDCVDTVSLDECSFDERDLHWEITQYVSDIKQSLNTVGHQALNMVLTQKDWKDYTHLRDFAIKEGLI